MRLSLTRAEAKVLLQHFNSLADRNIRRQIRIEGDQRYVVDVRRFIRKLLVAGLKSGDLELPPCFRGPEYLRLAARVGERVARERRRVH
jgi:hypothetical protein